MLAPNIYAQKDVHFVWLKERGLRSQSYNLTSPTAGSKLKSLELSKLDPSPREMVTQEFKSRVQ